MELKKRVLGRVARAVGWWCVVGLALLIVDMASNLPTIPDEWWLPPEQVQLPPGGFDLRVMIMCPGPVGWLGSWGYMTSWLWLPYAIWRAVHASRAGVGLARGERVLLAVVPLLILVVQLLLRGTPLKYGYPLA